MIEMIFQSGQSLLWAKPGKRVLPKDSRLARRAQLVLPPHRTRTTSSGKKYPMNASSVCNNRRNPVENELLRALRESPPHERENATLEAPADFSLAKLQTALPSGTALVEYYSAGDRLVAAVVTRETIEIIPLTIVSRVAHWLHLLRFQFSKFRMGNAYTQRFQQSMLRATWGHLETLYGELILPLRAHLRARHLVFVPHGPLHSLPFHALRIGDEYLGDAYTISYAPSATVFALCQQKAASEKRTSLILGIPDERAPQILTEVESVAALLPRPDLFIGNRPPRKSFVRRAWRPDCCTSRHTACTARIIRCSPASGWATVT